MRFMVLVKANKDSEAGALPSGEILATMGAFNEELAKAGVMLAGEGLQASSKGCRLRFDGGGKHTVTDGPFTESKELIAGFWIIQVRSKEEAIEWMSRAPFGEGEELEIRQVFEASDFPQDIFPAEAQEAEQELRDRLQGQYSNS
ncbi:MAG: YciI family protein [Chloroflexi bacterium]|nr:MAG: YciI family protein [Chloroflexota bacterium]